MRKRYAGVKLSRTTNERKQLFRNLVVSTVKHGFIVTSQAKAKAIKPKLEHLVTWAKNKSLTSFRKLVAETGDVKTSRALLDLGELFKMRPGGYTRIIKLNHQQGDNSAQVRLEWVEKLIKPEVVATAAVKETAEKSTAKGVGVKNTKQKEVVQKL